MTDRKHKQNKAQGFLEDGAPPADPAELRKRAEEEAGSLETQDVKPFSPEQTRQTLHELQVHQIELEIQNEELRRAYAELNAVRARYFDLYDLAAVGYVTVNDKGRIVEANLNAATLLGMARAALVKQPLSRFILPEDQDIFYRHRKQLLETGTPQRCELRMLGQDGTQLWVRMEAAKGRDGEIHSTLSDITERQQAEAQVKSQLEELQRWQDVMLGREDRVQELKCEVNEFCRLLGETARYPSQEADLADSETVEPRHEPEGAQQMITNPPPSAIRHSPPATILAVDDAPEFLEMMVETLTPAGYQVQLADSGESALAAVAANPPDLILLDIRMRGMDGIEVCRRLKAREETQHIPIILISGYAQEKEWVEGLQLGVADYIAKPFHPTELLMRVKTLLALRRANVSLEHQAAVLHQTNEQLQAEFVKRQRVEDELRQSLDRSERSRWALLSTLEDQKRAEAERERLQTAIEQTNETIVITDLKGTIQYVNFAFERITGYTKAEAIGQNPRILKSGCQDETFYRNLWTTISGGNIFHGRMVNKRKDGTFFTEEATIYPVRDATGTIVSYVAVKRDITERLLLEVRFQQAQKLEIIGTLAGGIAHDFNNILTAILGYAEFAQKEVGEQSKAGEDLEQVITAGKRAVELVRQILTISRQSEQQQQSVKIQHIVKEALKLLRPSISTSIRIKSTIDSECPTILADPTEIHQVIMNLCTNAYHAMRDMSRDDHVLELRLAPIELDETAVLNLGLNISPGRFAKMSVADTGCGMDAATMARIFEPYFTTKKKGQGTGLGLATVHSIVVRGGGAITVESQPGEGAMFCVYFPAYEGDPKERAQIEHKRIVERGTERIMVIDDEEPLARLLQRMLEKLGYQVSAFTSSEDAMRIFTEQPLAFDLVITDMNMPKMIGTDLARAFLGIRPDIPIILCTGFSGKTATEKAKAIGIRKFVNKPVDSDVLARLVRKILDEDEMNNDQ